MLIWDGVKDPELFELVLARLQGFPATTREERRLAASAVAAQLKVPRYMVLRIRRQAEKMHDYPLRLQGNGVDIPVATVRSPRDVRDAAFCALRTFTGTFRTIELPGYVLVSGARRIPFDELARDIGWRK